MTGLSRFTINTVSRKLNTINAEVTLGNARPFPCHAPLSQYRFKKRFVEILPNGDIRGGFSKMIISLIDFSFVRSLTAHRYAIKSPHPYDPPSMFLLELFRYIDGYQSMDRFLLVLRDKDRGRAYRSYAGIKDQVPTKGTFSNFKARLGPDLYNEIFHILVSIFHKLQMITFNILAHDGTLYPTRAKYKGCIYFTSQCAGLEVNDIQKRIKKQIKYRINNLHKVRLDKEIRLKTKCPSDRVEEESKRKKVEVIALKLSHLEGKPSLDQETNAIIFKVQEELKKSKLGLTIVRSNINYLNTCNDTAVTRCPKLPKDSDARIGVRRDPQNPSKKQKIFGYNLVMSTSVELNLKLELPVAVTNIAGNAEEGSMLIENKKQIDAFHETETYADLADAKYDIIKNYDHIRKSGSIPIIDYNSRNETLTASALRERGYDTNGWPFAPCGIATKPNGFDAKKQRHTFCCFKQCRKMEVAGIKNLHKDYDISDCKYVKTKMGYTSHTYIKHQPRLQNEIPRGTQRYNELKQSRSASERANSTIKEDVKVVEKPFVYSQFRADILAQIATILLLLKRSMAFIVKTTLWCLKQTEENSSKKHTQSKKANSPTANRCQIQTE